MKLKDFFNDEFIKENEIVRISFYNGKLYIESIFKCRKLEKRIIPGSNWIGAIDLNTNEVYLVDCPSEEIFNVWEKGVSLTEQKPSLTDISTLLAEYGAEEKEIENFIGDLKALNKEPEVEEE